MTKDEILRCPYEMLTAEDIAEVLQSNPQDIRDAVRMSPEHRLGEMVFTVIGRKVKVPKNQLIRYMRWNYD